MHKAQVVNVMCYFTVCGVDGQQLFIQLCDMNEHAVSAGHVTLM